MAELTAESEALMAAFSINERDADGTVIGHVLRDDPVPLVAAIEAAAVRDWLASPRLRQAVTDGVREVRLAATWEEAEAAFLAALREPPRERSA